MFNEIEILFSFKLAIFSSITILSIFIVFSFFNTNVILIAPQAVIISGPFNSKTSTKFVIVFVSYDDEYDTSIVLRVLLIAFFSPLIVKKRSDGFDNSIKSGKPAFLRVLFLSFIVLFRSPITLLKSLNIASSSGLTNELLLVMNDDIISSDNNDNLLRAILSFVRLGFTRKYVNNSNSPVSVILVSVKFKA